MIGSVLRSRYELASILSEGPIFTCYSAIDRVQACDVSIRLFKPPFDREEAFLAALKVAIEQTTAIRSPSVEAVQEVALGPGSPLLISEYARGMTLAERIKKLAPFSIPVSVAMAISILEGLEASHALGFAHGWLGAHSVWVESDGRAKIQLPGIWAAFAYSETAGAVVLPLLAPYLAPEISAGGTPSAASDLYAVGVLLYQLLLARLPYNGDTALAMALKHATDPVPSAKTLNGSIPTVLDEIIKKALAKEPSQRYARAGEMLEDLRALQDALRFGKRLSWPVKAGAAASEPVERPKPSYARQEPQEVEARNSDVPAWLMASFFAAILVVVTGLGAFFYTNLNRGKFVAVPNLRNMTAEEAKAMLAGEKLRYRVIAHVPSEGAPVDTVVDFSPPAGTKVRQNSDVSVKLSAGAEYVEAPDLTGRTLDEARTILSHLNLELDDRIEDVPGGDTPKGQIVASSPAKGTKVERGARVHVQVSTGEGGPKSAAPPKKYLYTLNVRLKGLVAPTEVKIDIVDDLGTRTLFDETKQPDDSISLHAEGYGPQATFKIYYDGQLKVSQVAQGSDESQAPGAATPEAAQTDEQ